MRRLFRPLALLATLALVGCSDDPVAGDDIAAKMEAVRAPYMNIVHASYEDSLALARKLDETIADFIADPSEEGLEAAQKAWLDSREPYLQTEVYRFYGGPIDVEGEPGVEDGPEGLINAWPMDEAYVDYVRDGDDFIEEGIVNDTSIDIDGETLEGLNEADGEKSIATGYHAIEFLLWGQDLSSTGPGDRKYTDYVEGDDGTHKNQARRGAYLSTASALLVGHLEDLVAAWAEGDDNYHHEFKQLPAKEAFARILTGMVVLSGFETGGERIETALESGDQEDEHSCFSDNTDRDMVQDCRGIRNVWNGVYTRLDAFNVGGPGVRTVVQALNPDLAEKLDYQIDESLRLAEALQDPFDREISFDNPEGRERVQALADSLGIQNDLLEQVFRELELDVPNP